MKKLYFSKKIIQLLSLISMLIGIYGKGCWHMKFKRIVDIIYFLALQISFGFMFWILYCILPCFETLLSKFIIIIIFAVGIAFPNFDISENLFKNAKRIVLTFFQVGISTLVCNILFSKFGAIIIRLK